MRRLFKGLTDDAGNLEPGRVYPDQWAPIIRNGEGGPELVKARWGMPSPRSVLKTERDPGVTNIRNLASPHWHEQFDPAKGDASAICLTAQYLRPMVTHGGPLKS
ncbi:SOS response-associated peptidase family protein [Paracoccus liaowanqingii]|nr:hypothetical protein [Paracoccus liaowanqingii]